VEWNTDRQWPARGDEGDAASDLREQILRRFEAWLDEALADEDAPSGIAAEILSELRGDEAPETERRRDLYSMWSAITALTQEVKLQGRTFKDLSETLGPQADLASGVKSALQAHEEALSEARRIAEKACASREERDRQIIPEAERRARREMLDVVLDVRDRLTRGLETVHAYAEEARRTLSTSWWRRLLGGRKRRIRHALEGAAALEKGYMLSLERLDEALGRFGVREVRCEGRPFDPRLMKAVDIEETRDTPEGTVLEVYRTGYEWNGEVFRPAEIKAARAPRNTEESHT